MAKAVELGPYLTDLSGDELVMVHQPIFAERASCRAAGDLEREGALPKQGHAGFVIVSQLIDLAILDPLGGVEHLLRRDVVRGARLVIGTPFRGPPFLLAQLWRSSRVGRRDWRQ